MRVGAWMRLLRIHNAVFGSLTVAVGALLFACRLDVLLLGVLTYITLACAGNVVNDIMDLEVDRVNRPDRPLPSGVISLRGAWRCYFACLSTGLALAVVTSVLLWDPLPAVVASLFAVLGYAYSARLKLLGLIGNAVVALSFSFGYVYGWLISGHPLSREILAVILFFVVSFSLLLAREIIKGIEDIPGDALRDVRTLARTRGVAFASRVASALLVVAVIAFSLLALLDVLSPLFIPFMIAGDAMAVAAIAWLTRGREGAGTASLCSKCGAFVGLVGFLVGVIT